MLLVGVKLPIVSIFVLPSAAEWAALATAAGVRAPSPESCNLTVTILRQRNGIADRSLSEEPQKLSLNLHGNPCMTRRGGTVKATTQQLSNYK